MSVSTNCPNCGGPVTDSTEFCQFCNCKLPKDNSLLLAAALLASFGQAKIKKQESFKESLMVMLKHQTPFQIVTSFMQHYGKDKNREEVENEIRAFLLEIGMLAHWIEATNTQKNRQEQKRYEEFQRVKEKATKK